MTKQGDFWSLRRAAVAAEDAADQRAAEEQVEAAELAALEELDDAEILAALDLPDPDTLQLGDNVAGFMRRAVPDHLRRRALRRLWRINPVLANLDGLNDYDEDFGAAAALTEPLRTSYQVGKGLLAHIEALAKQAEPAAEETTEEPATESQAKEQATEEPAVTAEPDETPPPERAPRRMRFTFEPGTEATA